MKHQKNREVTNMNKLEDFIYPKQSKLFTALKKEFSERKILKNGKYLLICGDAPVMLLAHLDTVHKAPVRDICKTADGNILMSPQGIGGDDRCGVYALVKAHRACPVKPWLLFLCDEEIGGVGARAFAKDYEAGNLSKSMQSIKFLVEIDRKGCKDAVYYDCDNPEFEQYITGFGFETNYGSYSDICDVAPAMGVAAVNLSSGYYNAHTTHEYINRKEINNTISKTIQIVADACREEVKAFEYIEAVSYKGGAMFDYYKYYGISKSVPEDLPGDLARFYEDLLDIYSKRELEEFRKVYGDFVLCDLYEDAFGPFYEVEDKT